jgi:hypothetical protein
MTKCVSTNNRYDKQNYVQHFIKIANSAVNQSIQFENIFLPVRIDKQKIGWNPRSNKGKTNSHTPIMFKKKCFQFLDD